MKLRRQQQAWDDMAALDPYWAVLSDPGLRYGRWEADSIVGRFARSGEEEVEHVLGVAARHGAPEQRNAALDFGCGLGRLTGPLSTRFDHCVGVDISHEMVRRAAELHAQRANCAFRVNTGDALGTYPGETFDLVLSALVLQHMPTRRIATTYVERFLQVLRPGGLAVFQVPEAVPRRNHARVRPRAYHALRALGASDTFLYRRLRLHPITMSVSIPRRRIAQLAHAADCEIVDVEDDTTPGGVSTPRYYVRRRPTTTG